jgi:hypothetical protein
MTVYFISWNYLKTVFKGIYHKEMMTVQGDTLISLTWSLASACMNQTITLYLINIYNEVVHCAYVEIGLREL